METIPDNAQDALAQGWHMVCVTPSQFEPEILLLILVHCEKQARFKFTRNGKVPHGEANYPLWIRGFKWSPESRRDLLILFFEKKEKELYLFIRKIFSVHMPEYYLTHSTRDPNKLATSRELKREIQSLTTN